MSFARRLETPLVLAGLLVLAVSCGKKGPPRPPEPTGPFAPTELEVRQIGPTVLVGFVAPAPRSDKPSQQIVRAELVRVSYTAGREPPPDAGAFRRRGEVAQTLFGDPLDAGERLVFADDGWMGAGDATDRLLRYAVRVRDRRGRSSPLVVARDLSTVELVDPPVDLVAEPTADGVLLTWTPSVSEQPHGYNLYRAEQGELAGWEPINRAPLTVAEYVDRTVTAGVTYLYEVRASLSGKRPYRESLSSNRVALVAEDRFAPQAPTGLVAVQEGTSVRLFWDPGQERDLAGYRVYRRTETTRWTRIGPDTVGEPLFLDTTARPGDHLLYRVTAIDRAQPPNESAPSEDVPMDVVEDPAETTMPEGP